MKAFVFVLLFCTGMYFATKATTEASTVEVSNITGSQSCIAPNSEGISSNNHKSCCIIMDRASVIIRQYKKHEAQN